MAPGRGKGHEADARGVEIGNACEHESDSKLTDEAGQSRPGTNQNASVAETRRVTTAFSASEAFVSLSKPAPW